MRRRAFQVVGFSRVACNTTVLISTFGGFRKWLPKYSRVYSEANSGDIFDIVDAVGDVANSQRESQISLTRQ